MRGPNSARRRHGHTSCWSEWTLPCLDLDQEHNSATSDERGVIAAATRRLSSQWPCGKVRSNSLSETATKKNPRAIGAAERSQDQMPWSKFLTFTDPFPYQSAIRAADWEIFPTAKGEFRAELTQINLNKLWMQRYWLHHRTTSANGPISRRGHFVS